jgi:hypothetical protein
MSENFSTAGGNACKGKGPIFYNLNDILSAMYKPSRYGISLRISMNIFSPTTVCPSNGTSPLAMFKVARATNTCLSFVLLSLKN